MFAAVNLIGLDPSDYKVSPASASATYSLTTAGLETATGVGSNTWVSGIATSEFDVFAQLNSGAVSSGTTGAWINLGTTRSWTVSRAVVGISSADLTVSIRSATSGDVLATANVIITAQVDV